MRTKLIYSNQEEHSGYGAGSGDTEVINTSVRVVKAELLKNTIIFRGLETMMFIFFVQNAIKNID